MDNTEWVRRDKARIDRRTFLRGTAVALPVVYATRGGRLRAESGTFQLGQAAYPGIIVRQSKPENYEFPFPTLNGFLTPNNLFYVRTHFGIYKDMDLRTWRLKVEGRVEHPL